MKKLPFILATVIMSLGGFSFAYADTIASQSVADSASEYRITDAGGTGIFWQQFGTGYSGTITDLAFRFETGSVPGTYTVGVAACATSGRPFQSPCNATTTTKTFAVSASSSVTYSVTLDSPITISSAQYLTVFFYGNTSQPVARIPGSVANTIAGGECWFYSFGSDTSCANINDIYMTINGFGGDNNVTRITGNISPSNVTDADAYVTLTYSYFNGVPSVTTGNYILRDLTIGQSIAGISAAPSGNGNNTYSKNLQLTVNRRYSWQPYLVTSDGNLYGSIYYFNTGSSTPTVNSGLQEGLPIITEILGASGNFNALETIGNLTESNSSSTLEGFVNNVYSLQNVLVTKFPFNYFVEIANTLDEILSSSTSTTAYTFSVNFSGNYATSSGASPFSILPTTWTVIAPSTMDVYYPESIRNFFRSLLLTVIVVAWGFMMFNRVRFLFA